MILVRRVAVGVAVTAVVAGLVLRYFLWPSTAEDPTASDAVAVLAGSPGTRLPVAVKVAERGPRVLVISAPRSRIKAAALCAHPGALTVYCFQPVPADTRGEARAIGRLAAQHGWRRIAVVTSTYHVTRAALVVRRCTDATVLMVAAPPSLSVREWFVRVAHEIGGLAVAFLEPSC